MIVIVITDGWSFFFIFRVIPIDCELMPDSPLQSESLEEKKELQIGPINHNHISLSRRVWLVKTPPYGMMGYTIKTR